MYDFIHLKVKKYCSKAWAATTTTTTTDLDVTRHQNLPLAKLLSGSFKIARGQFFFFGFALKT